MTTGLQFVVGWWYRREAVFYLPPGWFGPLGWVLALPFAPKGEYPQDSMLHKNYQHTITIGSVSVGVWQMACRRILLVAERVVKAFTGQPLSLLLIPATSVCVDMTALLLRELSVSVV